MKLKIKNYIITNQIKVFITISVLFALGIHCLYSIHAPSAWLEAKWNAGDILTYASTVSLGLLALWQNIRFKKENDISQKHMEQLAIQANELQMINKIIESENTRIERLIRAEHNFYSHCDIQVISAFYYENYSDSDKRRAAINLFDTQLNEAFYEFLRELANDPCVKTNEMKDITQEIYTTTKKLLNKLSQKEIPDTRENIDTLSSLRLDFLQKRNNYYVAVDAKYRQLVFGQLSLSDIKSAYQVNNLDQE